MGQAKKGRSYSVEVAVIAAAVVFFVDMITKQSITQKIPLGVSVQLVSFLSFTHVENTGVVWGIGQTINGFLVITLLTIFAMLVLLWVFPDIKKGQAFFGMILGGTLGNLVDRILDSAVTDFIDVHVWPIFNVADAAIVIGVVGLMIATKLK